MTVYMPKDTLEHRLGWVLPIIEKHKRIIDILKIFPHSERTLKRWVATYKKHGSNGLVPKSTAPKTQPHETLISTKERVIDLRKQTKLCAQKLHWKLKKQGLIVPVSTVSKIIKQEGLTRKYRVKKVKYKYLRAQRQPGELLEMDVKHVPGTIANKRYYQYTVIDTASRWRHLEVFDEESTYHAVLMMDMVKKKFQYPILGLKTDNHSTFTNYYLGTNSRSDLGVKTLHALDVWCKNHGVVHYLIDPGKPAQNGTIERSHREDQEKFYEQHTFQSVGDLKKKIRVWNDYYNDLEHCGLNGKTPNEMLYLLVTNVIR